MSERWFAVGAFSDTSFAEYADTLCDRSAFDPQVLFETDIFLANTHDPDIHSLPSHLLILDTLLDARELEQRLLCFGGRDFLSRLGHEITNLFTPLAEYHYLSPQTITSRVERGLRLGTQLNLTGHILQRDLALDNPLPSDELLERVIATARKKHLSVSVEQRGNRLFSTLSERLANAFTSEIVANWSTHSCGEQSVTVETSTKKFIFHNHTRYSFPYRRLKAVLRRPYQKFGSSDGNGLGLFLIGLIAYAGGFSWDITAQDGLFSLSFSFGASQ